MADISLAKGELAPFSVDVPFELIEQFKDAAYWNNLGVAEATEEAMLGFIQSKQNKIRGVYVARPEGAIKRGRKRKSDAKKAL